MEWSDSFPNIGTQACRPDGGFEIETREGLAWLTVRHGTLEAATVPVQALFGRPLDLGEIAPEQVSVRLRIDSDLPLEDGFLIATPGGNHRPVPGELVELRDIPGSPGSIGLRLWSTTWGHFSTTLRWGRPGELLTWFIAAEDAWSDEVDPMEWSPDTGMLDTGANDTGANDTGDSDSGQPYSG